MKRFVCAVFLGTLLPVGADKPGMAPNPAHLASLDTWLEGRDPVETEAARGQLREALMKEGKEGEALAQHLLRLVRERKVARDVSEFLMVRASKRGKGGKIVPHLDGEYLREFARMSVPDDASQTFFRRPWGAFMYLKLHPEDHEVYWRLRLAATRDAQLGMMLDREKRELQKVSVRGLINYRGEYKQGVNYDLTRSWKILEELQVLKVGMSVESARKILGSPNGGDGTTWSSWSRHSHQHVNPWLGIEMKDGTVVKIRIGNG